MASCNIVIDSEGNIGDKRVAHDERSFFLEVRNMGCNVVEVFR